MDNDDDDVPQLSAETFAALQEFYQEEEHREVLKTQDSSVVCDMNSFNEDWNLSQFWYNDETSKILAKECLRCAGADGRIACISAPSIYVAIKKNFPEATNQGKNCIIYVVQISQTLCIIQLLTISVFGPIL